MALPNKGLYGDPLAPGSVGPRQVPSNPASKPALPPLQVHSFCRNNKHPSAQMWNALHQSTNQATLYRTREYFSCVPPFYNCIDNPSTSDRDRWRFAFRTGVYAHAVYAVVSMVPTNDDLTSYARNTQAKLIIYSDTAESVVVSTTTFTYGVHPLGELGSDWGFQHGKIVHGIIEGLSADTQYYAKFIDTNVGRIQSATVFELQSMTETFDGYLTQSLTAESEIYDSYRENVATLQKNLWKRGGAKVFNWTRDDGTDPLTFSSLTPTNIFDQTSTTYGSSIPGITLNMSYKDRVAQSSGVPVKMFVFASSSGDGFVNLRNSSGASVLQATVNSATPGWYSVSGYLPATSSKYYLTAHADTSGGPAQVDVYAATCSEHEA